MIHLISGKGGVGKSTLAASFAWGLANAGKRTLLVEFGERSYFRHIFNSEIGAHPMPINSHLHVTRWDGEVCLREYLVHLLKIERVVKLFFDNKIMKALVQAAPALKELALLGKVTSGERHIGPSMPYDEIVVDAYATGHFRALWRAPVGLAEAIPFGPMGEQSRSIVRVLKDPNLTRFYVVMIAEDLPLSEGLELAGDIRREMEQNAHLLLNRWLECPLSRSQLVKFKGNGLAEYLDVVLERQERLLKNLKQQNLPLLLLPWLFTEVNAEKIRALSSHLAGMS